MMVLVMYVLMILIKVVWGKGNVRLWMKKDLGVIGVGNGDGYIRDEI